MKYEVSLYQYAHVEVEASSFSEAREIALKTDPHEIDWDGVGVSEVVSLSDS